MKSKSQRILYIFVSIAILTVIGISSIFDLDVEDSQSNESLVEFDFAIPKGSASEPQLEWEEYIGTSSDQVAYSVWANDTHVYTSGWTGSTTNAYITKSDVDGNEIWTRTWGGSSWEKAFGIVGDDEYIYVCGETVSYSPNSYADSFLSKWDADGNLIWYKTWGSTYEDKMFHMCLNGTSIYLIGNNKTTSSTTTMGLVLLKYDTNGNFIWGKGFNGPLRDSGQGISVHGDYLYAGGITYSYGAGGADLVLIKWDGNGNQIWYRTWGGPSDEWALRVWTDTNNVYISGESASYGAGSTDMCLIKWDHDGNQVWNRTLGDTGMDGCSAVTGDEDGVYLAGYISNPISGDKNAFIAKWSLDGNQIWNRSWGGTGTDYLYDNQLINKNYYTVGYTTSSGSGGEDCLVLKWKLLENIPDPPILNVFDPNPDFDGSIDLDWNDIVYADNYTVYRHTSFIDELNGTITTIGTSLISSFTDVIEKDITYYYVVTATNETGVSILSNCESVVIDLPGPDEPILNSIDPNPDSDGNITLNWNDVAYADNYTAYRYNSYITELNGTITTLGTVVGSSFTDYGVGEGTFYYVVTATNETGVSEISNCESVTIDIPGPDAPILTAITPNPNSDGNIDLDWNDVTYAINYTVYRYNSHITELNGSISNLGSTMGSSFMDYGVGEGTFYYVVIATNETGTSDISNCESVTVDIPGPNAPVLAVITPSTDTDGNIALDWNDVSYTDNYTVYRHTSFISELNGGITNLGTILISSFDDVLTAEGTYYYVVTATNETGISDISNCMSVIVDLPAPIAPNLDPITPNPDIDGNVLLNWNDVVNAESYTVYRATSPITDISGMSYIAQTDQSNYIDEGLGNGGYYYVVVAIGPGGESDLSNNQEVIVEKPEDPSIPGYNVWIFLGVIGFGSLMLLLKKYRRHSISN